LDRRGRVNEAQPGTQRISDHQMHASQRERNRDLGCEKREPEKRDQGPVPVGEPHPQGNTAHPLSKRLELLGEWGKYTKKERRADNEDSNGTQSVSLGRDKSYLI